MHLKYSCILLLLITSVYSLSSQSNYLVPVADNRGLYTDGIIEGKLHTFEHIFQNSPIEAQTFSKFNHNRKVQRWVNYMSAVSALGGLIDGARDASQGTDVFISRFGPQLKIALIVAGIGNFIAGRTKSKAKQKLLSFHSSGSSLITPEVILSDFRTIDNFNQISKHRFQYNDQTGRLHKMGAAFDKSDFEDDFYQFNKYRKKQVKGNLTAVGLVGVSTAISFAIVDGSDRSLENGLLAASIIVLGGGSGMIVAIVSNLKFAAKKSQYRSRLLMLSNQRMGYRQNQESSLNLGLTAHGLGIVYQF